MNSQPARRQHRPASCGRGQSAVEFAIAAPVLIFLFVLLLDFGRFFAIGIAVDSAARAGAQYGCQNTATAADSTGMISAATAQWNNSGLALTVTPAQCTCVSGSSVSVCASNYCAADTEATFVTVNTSVSYSSIAAYLQIPTTIMAYLGLPLTGAFTDNAVMQVQQ